MSRTIRNKRAVCGFGVIWSWSWFWTDLTGFAHTNPFIPCTLLSYKSASLCVSLFLPFRRVAMPPRFQFALRSPAGSAEVKVIDFLLMKSLLTIKTCRQSHEHIFEQMLCKGMHSQRKAFDNLPIYKYFWLYFHKQHINMSISMLPFIMCSQPVYLL